jgi:hypothetical protein
MSSKKKRAPTRPPVSTKKQATASSSIVIPVIAGLMVVAIIVGAILSLEGRALPASAAAATGTLSVPVVTTQPRPTTTIPYPAVPRIGVKEAKAKMDKGQALLYDVRSVDSYNQSHPAGAISLPEDQVDARLSELPKDKELIFFCT